MAKFNGTKFLECNRSPLELTCHGLRSFLITSGYEKKEKRVLPRHNHTLGDQKIKAS